MNSSLIFDKLKYEEQINEFLLHSKIVLTKNTSYIEDIYHHIHGGYYSLVNKQNQELKMFWTSSQAKEYVNKFQLKDIYLFKHNLTYNSKIYILGCDSSYYSINFVILKIPIQGDASLEAISKRHFDFLIKTRKYIPHSIFKLIQNDYKLVN